ncbi:copper resistance protein CopC (plasmid) [Mycolicibacterium vanbaalenii]|nr:copper resistance protein CopC [Mycolicibacterium vanbaalenii]
MTWLRCGLIALAIAVQTSVGRGAGSAQAHPTLLFTEPAAEAAVAASPEAITLLFNEPVTIGTRAIVVLDQSRREVEVTAPTHP